MFNLLKHISIKLYLLRASSLLGITHISVKFSSYFKKCISKSRTISRIKKENDCLMDNVAFSVNYAKISPPIEGHPLVSMPALVLFI